MVEKPEDNVGKMESNGELLMVSRWSFGVARPAAWATGGALECGGSPSEIVAGGITAVAQKSPFKL